MKKIIVLAGTAALSACAVFHETPSGPTALADGAQAGMWSSKQPNEVNACLARIQAVAISSDRGTPLRFQVDRANEKQTRYVTQVSIFGDVSSNKPEARAATSCL